MFEYNLRLLRSSDVLPSREIAVQLLDSYKYHAIGQPLVLHYSDMGETRTLFVIGKKNGNGTNCGTEYYDIVNVESDKLIQPESLYWGDLG